jgi:dTDP-glucose 4,6-dehydratase
LCILNALHGDRLPVYGDGLQVRNWLHVNDFCRAIEVALHKGAAGEVYNVGGPDELANIDVVRKIVEHAGADPASIEFVTDRPGHDRRYSLSSEKVSQLGWQAQISFEQGLPEVVDWYRENAWWWEPIRSGDYREYYERQYGQKLGS